MKRSLVILIFIVLLCNTTYAETTMYTRNRVYLRNTNFDVINVLDFDTEITILYTKWIDEKEWAFAHTLYGDGYVSALSLSTTRQSEPTEYKVYEAENCISSKKISLITNDKTPVYNSNAVFIGNVSSGKTFHARKFFIVNGKCYAETCYNNKTYYVPTSYVSLSSGKSFPALTNKIKLTRDCYMEGERIKSGSTLNVMYYILGEDNIIYAYCYEGYLPTTIFKFI